MNKYKFLSVIAIVFLTIGAYGFYQYNKPVKGVENEKAFLTTTAKELITTFNNDSQNMSSKLLDQIIEVSGKISMIENNNGSQIIILGNGVKCELSNLASNFKKDQLITIKGIYSGYDDMFNELSLMRCQVIQ